MPVGMLKLVVIACVVAAAVCAPGGRHRNRGNNQDENSKQLHVERGQQSPSSSSTLAGKLEQLKEAYSRSLITDAEFEDARQQLIDTFLHTGLPDRAGHKVDEDEDEDEDERANIGDYNTLVWSDDFSGSLNMSKWKHEITMGGGGNWEFEYYINNRSNSFTENGILNIRPTYTADTIGEANLGSATIDLWGGSPADLCTSNAFYGCERVGGAGGQIVNPIQSARVRTAETFNFKYGRVEVRAKLPAGDWIWPAIWLLPRHEAYGTWPASGEIDVMESRGNGAGYPGGGVDTISSTLHYGPFFPLDGYMKAHNEYKLNGTDFSKDFHIFGMEWSSVGIKTYVDDIDTGVVLDLPITKSFWDLGDWSSTMNVTNPWKNGGMNAPFDQEFYLIMNVAVGGTNGYFDDSAPGKPWKNTSPTASKDFWDGKMQWEPTWTSPALQVDYVKIYQ